MRNRMKHIKLLSVLLVMSAFLVSCGKDQKNEWNKHYGYTNEEVLGTYSFSNVTDAFDGLTESLYCRICEDAVITITKETENSLRFNIKSVGDELNADIKGKPVQNDDGFLLTLVDSYNDNELTAYVYTNASGQIRLHGFVRNYYPSIRNYYFDVIKN